MNTLPKLVEKKSGSAIRTMFSAIAPRYDLLNHILSCNRDIAWREFAAKLVPPDVERVLDVCAGTGDLGLALLHRLSGDTESRNPSVVAIDFALPMLAIAGEKAQQNEAQSLLVPLSGDALQLPFPNETFDAVLCAFGVRNFESLGEGLREMNRVLRSGGVAVILEFCAGPKSPLRAPADWFMRFLLPPLGRFISGHDFAYSYLSASSQSFLSPSQLEDSLRESSFGQVQWMNLTFGVATAFRAVKE